MTITHTIYAKDARGGTLVELTVEHRIGTTKHDARETVRAVQRGVLGMFPAARFEAYEQVRDSVTLASASAGER